MGSNDLNGPGFHYLVGFRLVDQDEELVRAVHDWQTKELVIEGQDVFKEFEIYVQAANQVGKNTNVTKKRGFSSQGC